MKASTMSSYIIQLMSEPGMKPQHNGQVADILDKEIDLVLRKRGVFDSEQDE